VWERCWRVRGGGNRAGFLSREREERDIGREREREGLRSGPGIGERECGGGKREGKRERERERVHIIKEMGWVSGERNPRERECVWILFRFSVV
jgi:hypothetical protein